MHRTGSIYCQDSAQEGQAVPFASEVRPLHVKGSCSTGMYLVCLASVMPEMYSRVDCLSVCMTRLDFNAKATISVYQHVSNSEVLKSIDSVFKVSFNI